MSLLSLWQTSPEQLKSKQVSQLVAIAGSGKLTDGGPCSTEFREFLSAVPSEALTAYCEQCLVSPGFPDSGFVLQDVVNEIGGRLGAQATFGRYRGTTKDLGFDGLWNFPTGHSIVVEVKTTDAYRIDLNTIAKYRDDLIAAGKVVESKSSMLFVVGRQDTGDLEAQIRGSRFAWDIRLISVDALLRLLSIKEAVDDPVTVQRIHSILIPREFTKLDEIAELLFTTAADIKEEEPVDGAASSQAEVAAVQSKSAPVAFHEGCVGVVQSALQLTFVKRSRSGYSTPGHEVALNCSVSKEHNPSTAPNYWFAFHPHQREFLKKHPKAFLAFGCGESSRVLLVPFEKFEPLLDSFSATTKADRMYWHVLIDREGNKYSLRRKAGNAPVDLSPMLVSGFNT